MFPQPPHLGPSQPAAAPLSRWSSSEQSPTRTHTDTLEVVVPWPLGSLLLLTFLHSFCNLFVVWIWLYGRLCGENWDVSISLKQPEGPGRWREQPSSPCVPVTRAPACRCTCTHMPVHTHTCMRTHTLLGHPAGAQAIVSGKRGWWKGSAQEICRPSGCLGYQPLQSSPARSSPPQKLTWENQILDPSLWCPYPWGILNI